MSTLSSLAAVGVTDAPLTNMTNESNVQVMSSSSTGFNFVVYSIVVPLLFGAISLVGMIGNILVIYVILSRKRMRTVTNLLLLNLAFADLSFVVVIPPSTAYQFATHQWPFGDAVCKLMHFLVNVSAYVTVYTLVLISAIRYMTIVHHVATARVRTKRNVILMILGIWMLMLMLNVPVMLMYSSKSEDGVTFDCDHDTHEQAQYLFTTFFVFAYLLPLLVIGVFSVCILHHIQSQKVSMIEKNRRTRSSTKKRKASRLIILVVVIFAILWLPIHIHLLMAFYGKLPDSPIYGAVSVLFNCAAYANSCVNPFIYNHASREFRQAFREVMCCVPLGSRPSQRPSMSTATTKMVPSPTEHNGSPLQDGSRNHLLKVDEEDIDQTKAL